ncbi:MAG: pyridoxamine 5'-phosphate oxidase [Steroidobacteraceae bacterium]
MMTPTERLSDPLPAEPLETAAEWLAESWKRRGQPNPNAMTLATSTIDGRPSARIVLCKEIAARPGYVVFYTNYHSRKGRELAENPRAAAVLHFDPLQCQVRVEGVVEKAPEPDSDAYFASRALDSRIGAWASAQSEPIESRERLRAAVDAVAHRFGARWPGPDRPEATSEVAAAAEPFVPRPPHWGGYRLWAEAVELWVHGEARIHDRARWSRELGRLPGGTIEPGPWSVTRLQP